MKFRALTIVSFLLCAISPGIGQTVIRVGALRIRKPWWVRPMAGSRKLWDPS